MPDRPTETCAKCGEFINKDQSFYRQGKKVFTWKHVDADGNRIFRSHRATKKRDLNA